VSHDPSEITLSDNQQTFMIIINVENSNLHFIFQDSLMNMKWKITAFIRSRKIL